MNRPSSLPILKQLEGTHHLYVNNKGKAVLKDEFDDDEIIHSERITTPGIWRREQMNRSAKLEKQLKARWAVDGLIEDELNRFRAQYNRILDLLQHLAHSSAFSKSLPDSVAIDVALPQLINELKIEEAVIDEEMAVIQSNCILHLPFGPNKAQKSAAMACIQSEFKKIHRVITKAQNLRLSCNGNGSEESVK
ncbi:hypothetical protein RND71_017424 [Anisodus tanguticus]|uniref:Uncharacterized protein n=1 Tax=Anisodus tanguticus TaxID=243964 RepID=A0AAE1VA00_9SOLA|nr:hypothetical protein RND71_017424 [Anisodus tanguticus]